MQLTRLILTCTTFTVAVTLACSDGRSPASPGPSGPSAGDLGPDGSTLKIDAPTLQSPANASQIQGNPVLVFSNVTGRYTSFPVTYEVELRNPQNALIDNPRPGASAGATTSITITRQLEFDTLYTWRVRATYNGAFGPWSATRTFRTMPAGYISGNEVFDPLANGRTVGRPSGPVAFVPNMGLELLTANSYVTYELPQNLIEGQFSMMVTGIDEGSPGDKSKVMSMQEGPDEFNITDDDYRFTLEKRGRDYGIPGAVTMRVITGGSEEPYDTNRIAIELSDEQWYFWKITWRTGRADFEIRENSPTGRLVLANGVNTGARQYRPVPHLVHIGAPVGRNGPIDASIPGMIVRDVWVSGRARPQFPVFTSPTGGQ